jgi:hypothetical protein
VRIVVVVVVALGRCIFLLFIVSSLFIAAAAAAVLATILRFFPRHFSDEYSGITMTSETTAERQLHSIRRPFNIQRLDKLATQSSRETTPHRQWSWQSAASQGRQLCLARKDRRSAALEEEEGTTPCQRGESAQSQVSKSANTSRLSILL